MTTSMGDVKNNEELNIGLARLQENHQSLSRLVYEIKDNHLVHLKEDVEELRSGQKKTDLKIAYWTGGVGVVLAIVQIIISKL